MLLMLAVLEKHMLINVLGFSMTGLELLLGA